MKLSGSGLRRIATLRRVPAISPYGPVGTPYAGRYWAYSKEKMEEFEQQGRLVYTRTGMPEYKRYLNEMPGVGLQDIWTDIDPINARAAERLGYPTQKPLALLERILKVSSDEGDVVLDPFGPSISGTYEVHGIPSDLDGAQALFQDSAFDFERWAVSLVGAQPNEKQVGDRGIDGVGRLQLTQKAELDDF